MWFQQEQNYVSHPKFVQISDGSFRYWHEIKCWVESNLTDGIVPVSVAKGFRSYKPKRLTQLIAAPHGFTHGLLDVIDGVGYKMHDYLYFNPSREEVLARRKSDSERRRRNRERLAQEKLTCLVPAGQTPGQTPGQDAGRYPPKTRDSFVQTEKETSKNVRTEPPLKSAVKPPTAGEVFDGGSTKAPKPAAVKPTGRTRPEFSGDRFEVFPWTFEKARKKIGPASFDEFDFAMWLHKLDTKMRDSPEAMPREGEIERWILRKLDEELERRGAGRADSIDDEWRAMTEIWECRECGLIHEAYPAEAKKRPCLKRIQGDKYCQSTGGFTEIVRH